MEYLIAPFLELFDSRTDTATTGRINQFIGHQLMRDLLTHAWQQAGNRVDVLPGKPIRDDTEFTKVELQEMSEWQSGSVLDGWFLLDGTQLVAAEYKGISSASLRMSAVPANPEALREATLKAWETFVREEIDVPYWRQMNKIALPLKPPNGHEPADLGGLRRVLVIWTPISQDGRSPWSRVPTKTLRNRSWVPIEIEVLSASLYLRDLLAQGTTRLPELAHHEDPALEWLRTAIV